MRSGWDLAFCTDAPAAVLSRRLGAVRLDVVNDLAARGRRVLAVAEGHWHPGKPESNADTALALLALSRKPSRSRKATDKATATAAVEASQRTARSRAVRAER
jgi:hypothetical protein